MVGHDLARQLFASPGSITAHTRHLLAQAAGSHARLLDSARAVRQAQLDRLREAIVAYLRSPALPTEKRYVLDHPQFVEALHGLAAASDYLTGWDVSVAPGCNQARCEPNASLGLGRLGNVAATVLLRQWRDWCGHVELATDDYGRIHFPFCDWVLVLVNESSAGRSLFSNQTIDLDLDEHEARWSLPNRTLPPLVSMPRQLFDAMFIDNRAAVRSADVKFGSGPPWPRFERTLQLGDTRIRFESIADNSSAVHAELTGGIVLRMLGAIEQNAPHIHDQLCQCIRTIQGFELPAYAGGAIASFSVPTSPGVIGFNVQYTSRDEPRFSPYSFMWLGHELGHTLHYLIDDVAYSHGWRFLENPGDMTFVIPRYGRSLSVRTVFQVPYVHLFEWWLLMRFHERGFAGLPWKVGNETFVVGEDLRAEIDEAFDLIDQHARLTATGQAIVARLRELVADADSCWRKHTFGARRHLAKQPGRSCAARQTEGNKS